MGSSRCPTCGSNDPSLHFHGDECSNEFHGKAPIAALTAERDKIVGIVQRLQPKGSPIPGDSVTLVSWIVDEAFRERDELRAVLREARGRMLDVLEAGQWGDYGHTPEAMRPVVARIDRAVDGAKGGERA